MTAATPEDCKHPAGRLFAWQERDDANALLAQINRLEAHQRHAGLPQRLDDAEIGDLLVLIVAGTTPTTRRLVEVEAMDGGALSVEGQRFHRGHGFALASIEAGNLDRMIQPLDDWSWPGLLAFLGLEL